MAPSARFSDTPMPPTASKLVWLAAVAASGSNRLEMKSAQSVVGWSAGSETVGSFGSGFSTAPAARSAWPATMSSPSSET